jgi:hypothetical protein
MGKATTPMSQHNGHVNNPSAENPDRPDSTEVTPASPKPLFKPTTMEETFGCLNSTVGTVSLEAMDEAVMREAKKHRT